MARDLKSLVGAESARELQENQESWQQDYEDPAAGELQLRDLACKPKCRLRDLEDKLAETHMELCQMEKDLKASRADECKTLGKLQQLNDYEQRLQLLQDEISVLDCQRSALQCRLPQSCSPCPCPASKCCDPCDACIPCIPCDPCDPCNPCKPCRPRVKTWSPAWCRRANASRRACLVARFNFIYAKERLDAEIRLKRLIYDVEMVRRIIYVAVVESFCAAKKAFWKIKIGVKETMAIDHCGSAASLEIAVLDYMAHHKELYDVCCSVREVICCMNINPKLPCPENIGFNVINSFIQELCCLAYSMQTLVPPLDVAFGIDGELFNRSMYYRSCDSDFAAPFVAYHIWPALMEGGSVLVKGEVVTRKMVQCYCRSKPRSRSCSCGRRLLPGQLSRSRSLSNVRFKTGR